MNRTKQTLLALCLALPFAAQAGPAENARPQARLNQPDASEQAKANLALVLEFFEGFFNRHDVSIAERLVAEDYRQHNPFVADGREPFVRYFSGEFASNPKMRTQILRAAVNDDLVFLHVHNTASEDDRGSAGVDIFRVKDGKIVEHWDVNQVVPEQAANANTMF